MGNPLVLQQINSWFLSGGYSKIDLFYLASYQILMKQTEYDQWNDPQELYSEDYFPPPQKKGVVTPHEYIVEFYLY